MSLDDYRWLVSDAATPWLALARDEAAKTRGVTTTLVTRLRKDLSAEQAHLVVEQVGLRERAREKFALAERMFFTRQGLEQATDDEVAACKAARFPAGKIADLCCGIGGDAIALGRHTPTRRASEGDQPTRSVSEGVLAIDLDPVVAIIAAANLRACDCAGTATAADAATFPVGDCAAWHIDPDRRPSGRRTTRVDLFAPSLETIIRLLEQNSNAAVKLAPAASAPDEWTDRAELCWLGSRGECRQQVAWFGSLARHVGQRSATIVDARGGPRTIVGRQEDLIPIAARLGRYLYEPHAAVLAAKLEGAICRDRALAAVSAGVGYLTSDALIDEPALDAFEIHEVLPLDQKRLKALFRQRQVGRLEVKKRGVDIDPARLRKAVIGEGDNAMALIISRVAGAVRAIVAARIPFSPSQSISPAD